MNAQRWLLVSALLLGAVHQLVLPPWMGEDEPWHFDYVTNVSKGHRPLAAWELGEHWKKEWLAEHPAGIWWATYLLDDLTIEEAYETQGAIVASMRAEHFSERVDHDPRAADPKTWDEFQGSGGHYHSYTQPGLYYVLSGALLSASGTADAVTGLYWVRGLSLLGYLLVVWITISLARLVTTDERLVLLAGIVVAWWPMHARQAAVVTNDVLVKVFVGVVILCCARFAKHRGGWRDLALAVVFLAAGLLTKTTAAGAVGALGASLLLARGLSRRTRWLAFVGVLGLVVAVGTLWLLTSNNAVPRTLERLIERVSRGASPTKLRQLLVTAVGTTNWESRWLHPGVYQAVGFALLAGFVVALGRTVRSAAGVSPRMVVFCLLTALAQIALIVLHGEAHGRYLFPVLPALAVLIAVGFGSALPARWRDASFVGTVLLFGLFETWFLWGELVPNHYLVWGS